MKWAALTKEVRDRKRRRKNLRDIAIGPRAALSPNCYTKGLPCAAGHI